MRYGQYIHKFNYHDAGFNSDGYLWNCTGVSSTDCCILAFDLQNNLVEDVVTNGGCNDSNDFETNRHGSSTPSPIFITPSNTPTNISTRITAIPTATLSTGMTTQGWSA